MIVPTHLLSDDFEDKDHQVLLIVSISLSKMTVKRPGQDWAVKV